LTDPDTPPETSDAVAKQAVVPAAVAWSLADRLTDLVLRGLIRVALLLPWDRRVPLMGWIMARLIAPRAGYRDRALANLAYVWPEMPPETRKRIAEAVANNAGRTIIENYDVMGLLARMQDAPISGPGYEAALNARETGQPVLFVTGHFGNFEAPRAALVARGFEIGGLYRPLSNPFFNRHYAANMHALSGPVFEQGPRGTMGLVRHLRQGGMGVLLFDIYSSKGETIDFMGRPTPTLTSAADIALRTDALLIPFFGQRAADGLSFEVSFDAPIPHGDPVDMTRAMSDALERRVRATPEQWFWIHRRWKPERQRRRAEARTDP